VRRFETFELPPGDMHHREHVELTWRYLREMDVVAALERLRVGLRRYAEHFERGERYHETVTCAYTFLIHERMAREAAEERWEAFAAANRDLVEDGRRLLERYYRPETLDSDLARRVFLLPDRGLGLPLPEAPPAVGDAPA